MTVSFDATTHVAKVCRSDGTACKLLKPDKPDDGDPQVEINQAGTLASITRGQHTGETWDLATGKRIASFAIGDGGYPCGLLDWAGDTLVVHVAECEAQNGGAAYLS